MPSTRPAILDWPNPPSWKRWAGNTRKRSVKRPRTKNSPQRRAYCYAMRARPTRSPKRIPQIPTLIISRSKIMPLEIHPILGSISTLWAMELGALRALDRQMSALSAVSAMAPMEDTFKAAFGERVMSLEELAPGVMGLDVHGPLLTQVPWFAR